MPSLAAPAPFRVVKDTRANDPAAMLTDILEMARCRRAEPEAVVIALADALAITAAQLDRHGAHVAIRERLESFTERVVETYQRRTLDYARSLRA